MFTDFGLFYIFRGWFYRIPMAVQPMKAASAAGWLNLIAGNAFLFYSPQVKASADYSFYLEGKTMEDVE